jgi:ABC-2 type transport system permease protein
MSTVSYALQDSATMLRRNLRRTLRYPASAAATVGIPLVFLLLFVYVFGDTLGAGLAGASGGRGEYLDYVTPGILVLTVAGAAQGVAISVSMDMTEGIIARFRTMAIARVSVLTGHVVGSLIQTLIGLAIIIGVALALGFGPDAGLVEWIAVTGLLTLVTFAVIWLSVALGMVTKSVEAASNLPMPLLLLPFLGSGFVPTDAMPAAVGWFARYQPFTPIIETVRGLLLGTAIGDSGVLAVAWSAAIGLGGYLWAKRLFSSLRSHSERRLGSVEISTSSKLPSASARLTASNASPPPTSPSTWTLRRRSGPRAAVRMAFSASSSVQSPRLREASGISSVNAVGRSPARRSISWSRTGVCAVRLATTSVRCSVASMV